MIIRNDDRDVVVTKFQGKLAPSQKFFVVPAFVIRVGRHARKPLRQHENIIAALPLVIREMFVASAATNRILLVNVISPLDRKRERRSWSERLFRVDPHERADDRMIQRIAIC